MASTVKSLRGVGGRGVHALEREEKVRKEKGIFQGGKETFSSNVGAAH